MNPVRLRPSGELLEPDVHDTNLVGIDIDEGDRVWLRLRKGSEVIGICCDGVRAMRCDGMREGNIILDIYVTAAPDSETLEWIVEDRIVSMDNATVLLLAPSYGATVGLVCERIAWESGGVSHF